VLRAKEFPIAPRTGFVALSVSDIEAADLDRPIALHDVAL
jgi:hypothetical protein